MEGRVPITEIQVCIDCGPWRTQRYVCPTKVEHLFKPNTSHVVRISSWQTVVHFSLVQKSRSQKLLCVCVCPVLCSAPMMNDIVVMDIHQHSDGLPDDERHPHGGVAVVSIEETAHEPSQRNLERWKFRGQCVFVCVWEERKWSVTVQSHFTWAIIPIKAHSLNIFRGTLTRYWRGHERNTSFSKNTIFWISSNLTVITRSSELLCK